MSFNFHLAASRRQERASKELLANFRQSRTAFEVCIDGKIYEIDFQQFTQTNQRTRKQRPIRCFFGLPFHWHISDHEALTKFQPGRATWDQVTQRVTDPDKSTRLQRLLNESILRHDGTRCQCLHGNSKFEVGKAYQVRNLPLWRRHRRFVRSIRDKQKQHGVVFEECPEISTALTEFAEYLGLDLQANERLLLHGTRNFEVAKAIAMEGFDNRIARSSGLYGSGTYFAAQTCKSAQYATHDGFKNKASWCRQGTMLLARVALGDPFFTPGAYQEGTVSRSFTELSKLFQTP